ncbi:MAG: DUF4124 domain-containing protein [Desulfobacteraceae bacterium]|jgi:chromosome segregation ATPase
MQISGNFIIKLSFVFLYFFFSSNAIAEFYSYTDDSGTVHYTDDYSNIPDEFKSQIVVNDEIVSYADEKTEPEVKNQEKSDSKNDAGISDLAKEGEALRMRKSSLDEEYRTLVEKQEVLESLRKEVKTKKQAKQYSEKLESLNALIKKYEEKRAEFNKAVNEYNQKVNSVKN